MPQKTKTGLSDLRRISWPSAGCNDRSLGIEHVLKNTAYTHAIWLFEQNLTLQVYLLAGIFGDSILIFYS